MTSSVPDNNPSARHAPLWLLALITFSGTLAMHIFVPALPDAARDLGASVGAMQLTMSVYILGLAAGQLVYGPISDHFGRRPVLMVGLVIYACTGLWAAFAPNVNTLIVLRLLQALGGCSGMVIGRAMVRDTAVDKDAGRRLALMNLMVVIGPGIAPLIGSAVTTTVGWRALFFLLSGLGVVNFAFTWTLLPETRPRGRTTHLLALARDYGRLLKSPTFLGYALGGGCATTAMYGFVAASPFIFTHQLGRPDYEVGMYLAVQFVGIWLGSMTAARLISRVPIDRLAIGANFLSVVAAVGFLVAVLSGHLSVPLVVAPMFLFAAGAGIASPAAMTQAISVNPKVVGSASGLYGFSQMGVGAACSAITGLGSNPALSAALVLVAAGVIAQASFWIAVRSKRRAIAES
ncbi:multidrug effflux MFS transporter [Enhydrobacter aerosaccus]|nr:multidrug effflux MFS transporter [Enhydrobacter aerosaccus]